MYTSAESSYLLYFQDQCTLRKELIVLGIRMAHEYNKQSTLILKHFLFLVHRPYVFPGNRAIKNTLY